MLTVESLRAFGADVEDGLKRCMNNDSFYLKMVEKAVSGLQTEDLRAALASGDLDKAFELCHAIKGVLANLSLTPVLEPVSKMTELLRARTPCDYSPCLVPFEEQLQRLRALCEE